MTVLNITIAPDFAIVSTDTLVVPKTPTPAALAALGVTADAAAAMAGSFTGNGKPPQLDPIGFASKLTVLPHLHMVALGSGPIDAVGQWTRPLHFTTGPGDVCTLNPFVPDALRQMCATWSFDELFIIAHVGWSRSEGRLAGFIYSSAADFEPVELTAGGGHNMVPPASPSDHDYPSLAERWTAAAAGEETELFHLDLARNQFHTYRAGLLRNGAAVGGELVVARIDAGGISVRRVAAFPEV